MSNPFSTDARNPPPSHGEARLAYRFSDDLSWPVDFEFASRDAARGPTQRHSAITRGIGVGGAFIVSNASASSGMLLRIWLHPPSLQRSSVQETLPLAGEVRWVTRENEQPAGFGLAFRAITAADEILLHRYFSLSLKMLYTDM